MAFGIAAFHESCKVVCTQSIATTSGSFLLAVGSLRETLVAAMHQTVHK